MRTGLTFTALCALFKLHRTTISTIFTETLVYLAGSCKNFVTWPSKETIRAMMPDVFKESYKNCRVIIDCTEFHVEQPSKIKHRVQFYSRYKKGFRLKVLVGCTPSGYISFVSRCYGGK
ncbi:GSCOCG00011854001-RA-CDS [Cotesia congregata]|nr:GSCOCG00011854001-RA-CDS [Cotesia congregata]